MFWKIPDLTLQLHLLTAKLMSSVGISLLCEILGNMTHHLPFCVESCIQKCLFIVKTASKLSYFSSVIDTVSFTLSQTEELHTRGSCIGSSMARLKKKGWMLTTETKRKILWRKIAKSLFCEKGSQVCSCGSSCCVSVMYSWAHAEGFHIWFGSLIDLGHVCRIKWQQSNLENKTSDCMIWKHSQSLLGIPKGPGH